MYLVDSALEIAKMLVRNDPNIDPDHAAEIAFKMASSLDKRARLELDHYNEDRGRKGKIDVDSVLLYRGLNRTFGPPGPRRGIF